MTTFTSTLKRAPLASEADARVNRLFFAVLTLYFTAQIALRLTLGGALETDEAEMLLMTPGVQWGYGPQLPLYNWVQIGLFSLFGEGLFALSLLKNLLLFATYAFVFLGLRAQVSARTAAIATLALFLIPDIAWEAERATTHSNMLLATIAASFAGFFWSMRTGAWRHWILLGLAVGCGGIAKYNYWAVPVGFVLAALMSEPTRRAILTPRALIVPVIAALIIAGPYLWMMNNSDLALSSVSKIQIEEHNARAIPEGVSLYLQSIVILALLPALVASGLWLAARQNRTLEPEASSLSGLFLRMGGVLALLGLIGVWVAGVGHITPRWLLPLVIPLVIGLYLRLAPNLSRRVAQGYSAILVIFAVLVCVGLTLDRYKDNARRDVDFTTLAKAIEAMPLPDDSLIVADFYVGGNLARLRPQWHIRSDLPASARLDQMPDVLLLSRDRTNDVSGLAQRVRWPYAQDATYGDVGQIDLPAVHTDSHLSLWYQRGTSQSGLSK